MNLKDEVKSIIYDALNVLKISFDKENLMVEVPKKGKMEIFLLTLR